MLTDCQKQTVAAFNASLDAALVSLDEQTIRAHHLRWQQKELPATLFVFWGAVHKLITSRTSLPLELRKRSKAWLTQRGLSSLDDDDL